MTNEEKDNFKNDVKKLLNIFERNKREAWGDIREFAFSISMKDYGDFSKYSAKLKNKAYGCKDQEKIKGIIARVSGYLYSKSLLITNEEVDDIFLLSK